MANLRIVDVGFRSIASKIVRHRRPIDSVENRFWRGARFMLRSLSKCLMTYTIHFGEVAVSCQPEIPNCLQKWRFNLVGDPYTTYLRALQAFLSSEYMFFLALDLF